MTRVWMDVPSDAPHLNFGDPGTDCYIDALKEALDVRPSPWVWLYTPLAFDMATSMVPGVLIYDVMDDLASFRFASDAMVLRQHQAIAHADVVFAGGRSLFEKARRYNPERSYLFPSGVEPEHYIGARKHRHPHARPVAGYVGVIDERLDLPLIAGLAARLPHWAIHMVGPVAKIDEHDLPRRCNIRYFGQRPYSELPRFMGGFDVALMPFALNEATRSISPTKTLEYLAAGLPVVSTRVPDVVADYGDVVDLQDDVDGFAAACERVLEHSLHDRDEKLRPLLALHHWDSIVARMEDTIANATRRSRAIVLPDEAAVGGSSA